MMIYYYLYCFILFSTVWKFCLYAIKPNPKSPQHPIPRGYVLLFFMLLEHIFVGDSMVWPLSACLPVCCLFVSLLSVRWSVYLFTFQFFSEGMTETSFIRKICSINFEKKKSTKLTTVDVFHVFVKSSITNFVWSEQEWNFSGPWEIHIQKL